MKKIKLRQLKVKTQTKNWILFVVSSDFLKFLDDCIDCIIVLLQRLFLVISSNLWELYVTLNFII